MIFKFTLIAALVFTNAFNYSRSQESQNDATFNKTGNSYLDTLLSKMTSVFHREADPKNIPYHAVRPFVTVSREIKDSKTIIRVNATSLYNEVYQLNLVPTEDNVFSKEVPKTVVWTVKSSPGQTPNYTYNIVDVGGQNITIKGQYYEDPEKFAVLLVRKREGIDLYDGVVGEILGKSVVRPLPKKWRKIYFATDSKHIIYKRSIDQSKYDDVRVKRDNEIVQSLYPKLLVIVDYDLFKNLGEDIAETIQYVTTFWNAVNLKFHDFINPQINIKVTGIVIAKDERALNYIYQARYKQNRTQIDRNLLLDLAAPYFSKQFISDTNFANYDAAITMTLMNEGVIMGTANIGTICNRNSSVAFVSDSGHYYSVYFAAHELGHLLGLNHDTPNCSFVPERENHLSRTSSIMKAFTPQVYEYVWSNCSKEYLAKLVSKPDKDCLKLTSRH